MTESKSNTIRVVYIPLEGKSETKFIEKTTEASRELVGGSLRVIDLFDGSFLIVNQNAERLGLRYNREASILARRQILGNAYVVELCDFKIEDFLGEKNPQLVGCSQCQHRRYC